MAAISAIVVTLARCTWRDLRSLGLFIGNNLFGLIALLMAEEPRDRPSSTAFFYLLMGLLYLFPMARDLSQRIPAERFQLWPLTRMQRAAIYAFNLALNPLLLIAILFAALSRDRLVGLSLFATGAIAPFALLVGDMVLRRTSVGSGGIRFGFIPRFPGPLGGLIQNHLRESLRMLDVYFAALLAVGGVIYRLTVPQSDPSATLVQGMLIVVLLSTLAQCHFLFDMASARMRARLLPVSGLQLLLAKDVAWFLLVLMLTWPYDILPCIAGAAAALAIGHHTAVMHPIEQRPWRFAQGRLAPNGILQMIAIASSGIVHREVWVLAPILALYAGSLWWFGKKWDEQPGR